jgi:ATP-binding cassette subfamily B protein
VSLRVLPARTTVDAEPARDLRQLRLLLPFVRPYHGRLAVVVASMLLAAGSVLAFGSGLRWLIDNGLTGGRAELLDEALVLMLAIVAVLAAATYMRAYYVAWIGERIAADIRRAVYDNILKLGPGFFEVTRTGEVLSRLTADTTVLQTVVGSTASMAIRNILMIIGGTIMMAVTSPKLTGLTFLVVPAILIPIKIFGRRLRRLSRLSQTRLGDMTAYAGETLGGIETVQSFTHEPEDRRRFGGLAEAAFETAIERTRARAGLAATVILLVFCEVGLILWIGGHDMLAGEISAGALSAFVFYAVVVASAAATASEFMGDIYRAAGASERLVELLQTVPDVEIADPATPLPEPARGGIDLENVSFAYPSRVDRPALSDFTLHVEPGRRVALVGPSGAGKSTVFQMILRFHDPQAGKVTFDGIDIRDVDPAELRRHISVVPQEPAIFAATIADNIRYGRLDAPDDAVRAAADAAAATGFIDDLPGGFETAVGERGVGLSVGQRQRLAIARAILRDAPLLLLDEATSALDSESESAVQKALEKLMAGRTSIVIAHRLATVLKADEIIVLDGGRIVAAGRHDELVAAGGLYARLAELQFDQRGALPERQASLG